MCFRSRQMCLENAGTHWIVFYLLHVACEKIFIHSHTFIDQNFSEQPVGVHLRSCLAEIGQIRGKYELVYPVVVISSEKLKIKCTVRAFSKACGSFL